jgi:hypothetical protein
VRFCDLRDGKSAESGLGPAELSLARMISDPLIRPTPSASSTYRLKSTGVMGMTVELPLWYAGIHVIDTLVMGFSEVCTMKRDVAWGNYHRRSTLVRLSVLDGWKEVHFIIFIQVMPKLFPGLQSTTNLRFTRNVPQS